MRRKQALALIRAEIAREGKVTAYALRLYIENRISPKVFRATADEAMKIYIKNSLEGSNETN
jgi:hypothetical protein